MPSDGGAGWVVTGGLLFDGSGGPPVRADVHVRDGRVVEAGAAPPDAGRIDAGGAWVLPGFVDAHSHADLAVLSGEAMEVRARAGVTTEIVGQDGLGYAPVTGAAAGLMAGVLAPLTGVRSGAPAWPGVAGYLDACDAGAYARVAALVPHGAVRAAVTGMADRPATGPERDRIAELVAEGMRDGAVGLSSGLSYPPARWAETGELVAAARPAAATGGRYVTHLRGYGDGFAEAIEEALRIGREAGVAVHFSHFHVSGPGRDGRAAAYLAPLRRARSQGQRISHDSYPYTVSCTFLAAVLPGWLQAQPPEELLVSLRRPATAARAARELDAAGPGSTFAVGWDGVLLAGLAGTADADLDGCPVPEAAARRHATVGTLVVGLAERTELMACVLVRQGHDSNVRAVAAEPGHVVGSDGILGSGVPHPRAAGAFLRYLRWARDGVVDVEPTAMVRSMTAATAELFDLPVGRLVPGAPADLLVADPDRLADGPDTGRWLPDAIRWSLIAGHPVVRDGAWTGDRIPGLALRRGARPSEPGGVAP
jgi:N-acyl-D-amino-acid deacylase